MIARPRICPTTITAGGVTATMAYDYTGERVRKTVAGGTTTTYVGALYECSASCTKYLFAGGTRVALKTSAGSVLYFHGNHLGSTHVVTDGAGAKVEEVHYAPYGATSSDTGSLSVSRKYTGQEFDPESGLYYYGARYYDPVLGRFASADTIGVQFSNPQSLNRYSYVLNNPLKYTDPTGHEIDEAGNMVQIVDGKLIIVGGAETDRAGQVFTAQWSPDTGQVANGWVSQSAAIDPLRDALLAEGRQRRARNEDTKGDSFTILFKGGVGTSGSGKQLEKLGALLNRSGRPTAVLESYQVDAGVALARSAASQLGEDPYLNLGGHSLGGRAAVMTANMAPTIHFNNLFTVDSVCAWGCGQIPGNIGVNYNFRQDGFLSGAHNSSSQGSTATNIFNWTGSDVTHSSLMDSRASIAPQFIYNTIMALP